MVSACGCPFIANAMTVAELEALYWEHCLGDVYEDTKDFLKEQDAVDHHEALLAVVEKKLQHCLVSKM